MGTRFFANARERLQILAKQHSLTPVVDTEKEPPFKTSENEAGPLKAMGLVDLTMFYVVTGVSLRWIATAASAGASSIVVWIGAWLFFYLPLVLAVIELSSRFPQEGGLYVWSKRAFGDFSGYIAGWSYWTSNLPYFPAVLYFAAGNFLFIGSGRWTSLTNSKTFYICFSIGALILITAMNVFGLNIAKWLHNVGSVAMWLPVLIIAVMGVYAWRHFGSATSFAPRNLLPGTNLKNILFWNTLIFAFGGAETGSFMSAEIKDPRRTIPRALLLAGVVVTVCYIGGTICVLLALPGNQVDDLQGLMQAISYTAARLGWSAVVPVAATLIGIANLGASGGYLASTARLPFVVGVDRFLPQSFARLHPRWRTPYVSLCLQMSVAILFVFLAQAGTSVKGAYDVLVSMGIITYFVPYLYLFAALFRFQREEGGPRVIHVPGGRQVARCFACVGFMTTLLTIGISLLPAPDATNKILAVSKVAGLSGMLIGVGAVLYRAGMRGSRADFTQNHSR
jgi:amino acid transporter